MKKCSDVANNITNKLIKIGTVPVKNRAIYAFGIELLIEALLNFALMFTLGLIFNRLLEGMIYLITSSCLRMFAGGLHTDNYIKCFALTVILWTTCLFFLSYQQDIFTILLLLLIGSIAILAWSPVPDFNKPLDIHEVKKYRDIAVFSLCLFVIIAIIILCFNNIQYAAPIALGIFTCGIFVAIGNALNHIKKGKA